MADFVLKRKKSFTFKIEDSKTVYEIPSVSKLPISDVEAFQKIQQTDDLAEQATIIKDFLFRYTPELKDAELGDTELLEIFGAYAKSQNRLGES